MCEKAGNEWQEVKPGFEVRGSVVQEGIVVCNSVVTFYVFQRWVGTVSLSPHTFLFCWLNVKLK